MKASVRMILSRLVGGVGCAALIFLLVHCETRPEGSRKSDTSQAHATSENVRVPNSATRSAPQAMHPVAFDNRAIEQDVQKSLSTTLPTSIDYAPTISVTSVEVTGIMNAVSGAVFATDRALETKQYRDVRQFDQTVWFEAVDKAHSTVWRIVPHVSITPDGTNIVVGAIHAIVYQDADLSKMDQARSFQVELSPENHAVRSFWWVDSHEVLRVERNGMTSYGRSLVGKKSLAIGWDENGRMVSSNVYDWANRGRAIRGWTKEGTPIYADEPTNRPNMKFGPTFGR